ncbi:MAG: stalk domain-containing protein [Syntrophomonadaceae bacterium]
MITDLPYYAMWKEGICVSKQFPALLGATLLAMLIWVSPVVSAPSVTLDGKSLVFDVAPVTENDRTLVPIRAVFEAMGAALTWDQTTLTATANKNGTVVGIKVGSTTPTINGVSKIIDVPAIAVNGRIMAPLRFVAEAFGGTVIWNQQLQTISIYSTPVNLPSGITPNNYVPSGHSFLTADGFEVTFNGLVRGEKAWTVIAAYNPLLPSPESDMEFVIVYCTVRNVSTPDQPETVSDIDFELVGSSGRTFQTFDRLVQLPVTGPDRELRGIMSHGEETSGSLAFNIPVSETSLFLVWHPYFSSRAYFEML